MDGIGTFNLWGVEGEVDGTGTFNLWGVEGEFNIGTILIHHVQYRLLYSLLKVIATGS